MTTETEPEPEPGYAKGRARRREIIEQAMAVFGELGYRATSLRDVAARCGISHPGLMHHFPTKESLLQAVLQQRDHNDAAWLGDGGAKGVDGLRRLAGLVALNATRRGIVESFTVLAAEASSAEHPAHDYFVARYRNSVASTTATYTQAAAAGALRHDIRPDSAGRQLVALMDGLQLQWLLDAGATDMAAVVRAHIQSQLVVEL
ncbi:MAG: TetR/AcrR family transcriptional regulator [Actinomycetota bacterium]|nr:TetR/AcrR family transcriptional regulator [Actinomycetota bacterium]